MFANVTIGNTTICALVDTEASDLFIAEEAAKKLNLWVEGGARTLKTVNSDEIPICGLAKDVELHIGQ